jgi:hypothetical protein
VVDWLAYFANRGLPQPGTLAGPRDWQSQSEYLRVSDVISLMGSFMGTDPEEGTNSEDGIDGLRAYISLFAAGDLTATRFGVWSGGGGFVNPPGMLAMHLAGGSIVGCYGRYTLASGGTRIGGHAVAVTGVWDLGCGQAPVLEFRDPSFVLNDPGLTGQSDFCTNLSAMVPVTGQFRNDGGSSFSTKTLYRLDKDTVTHNFLDGYLCIYPAAGLISEPERSGQLRLLRPFRPAGNPAPAQQVFTTGAGAGLVKGVAFAADQLSYYYSADGTANSDSGVWKLDPLTGQSARIVTLHGTVPVDAGPIATSRNGDLYMIVGASVLRYDLSAPNSAPIGSLDNISPLPQGIAYDDASDSVLVITAPNVIGTRQVLKWGRTLPLFGQSYPLPVNLGGVACIAPDADAAGAYFVCGSSSGVLYRLATQGADLVQTHSIVHLNAGLTGLNVTDSNTLVYAVNGVLVEKEQNAQGNWVSRAGSRWAGRQAVGPVALARTRGNQQASELGPTFNNLPDPDAYPFLPSCYANCDASTIPPVLNVLDFNCFLNRFATAHPYANCDGSTAAPVLNVLDFNCFLNRFAAGCP